MYECIQAAENTYYIASPVNMGIYVDRRSGEPEAWIIDTGLDPRIGKKIVRQIREHGWKPKAIINTHCHADHIGANAWLQKEFSIPIYSSGLDCVFIENTILSAMALWGGYPPKALQTMPFTAQNSKVLDIADADLPEGFEIIPLSGHSLYMFGIRTPDNVIFTADELCSPYIFEKYGISFNYYVEGYFKSLDEAEKLQAKLFIPAHGEPFENIRELVDINRRAVLETRENILAALSTPRSFDMLLQELFNRYGMNLTFSQYSVIGSTVRSYLAWLYDEGKIEPLVQDNILYWQTKITA